MLSQDINEFILQRLSARAPDISKNQQTNKKEAQKINTNNLDIIPLNVLISIHHDVNNYEYN